MKLKPVKFCSTCLMMSTRPRITFDDDGRCNACVWSEEKRSVDWELRHDELLKLLDKYRGRGQSGFDCLVPVSGGKDGSYVAYKLTHEYGMSPLCVTVNPHLPLELGTKNLKNFIESGYSHIAVSPAMNAMKTLNKLGLLEKGFPYYGWLIAIQTAPLLMASSLGIGLIFYGEDGEVEYGGSTETKERAVYSAKYMRDVYLESGYEKVLGLFDGNRSDRAFFQFPSNCDELAITHWSYFENWDPYRNYLVAKEFCGLQEAETANVGTFTNFAQNDQALYALHTYLMYLKFGFGRANQDASIEIRRGALDRSQALQLVKIYDGIFPKDFLDQYLDYYGMSKTEFFGVLDRWANTEIMERIEPGIWRLKACVYENA